MVRVETKTKLFTFGALLLDRLTMSGKYAFTKTLKELRFLHCQQCEHSDAVR